MKKRTFLVIPLIVCILLTATFILASNSEKLEPVLTKAASNEIPFSIEFDMESVTQTYNIYYIGEQCKELIVNGICIQDEARYEPIIKLDDSNYILDNRIIYNISKKDFVILELPLSFLNYAEVNDNKDKIAYVEKNEKSCAYEIGYIDLKTSAYQMLYSINPTDWTESFSPALYVSWKNNSTLYFDAPTKGVPTIYEIDISTKKLEVVKSNARLPVSLGDGDTLAYLSTNVFGGYDNKEVTTVIENKSGKYIELPGYRVLKDNDAGKIYVAGYGELITLDTKDLSVMDKKETDSYFNFATIVNGSLQFQRVIATEDDVNEVTYENVKIVAQ